MLCVSCCQGREKRRVTVSHRDKQLSSTVLSTTQRPARSLFLNFLNRIYCQSVQDDPASSRLTYSRFYLPATLVEYAHRSEPTYLDKGCGSYDILKLISFSKYHVNSYCPKCSTTVVKTDHDCEIHSIILPFKSH